MMRSGRLSIILLVVCVLSSSQVLILAVPPPSSATCKITCTVANIIEWSETSFPEVDLGTLTAKNKQTAGESTLMLYTNCDVTITADNSNAAELSCDTHTLLTEYKLEFDGSGIEQTGGTPTAWYLFDTFLKEGTNIIHTSTDGAVEVILSVRASVENIRPENSGRYTAIQTLTAFWKS